nr:MAG TPA: Protein of unknown function (DUF2829) [Caudoviricetes sp.]
MSYLEELLPEFRKGAKIRRKNWGRNTYIRLTKDDIIVNNDEKLQVLYTDELLADSWEFYTEPEPDWGYIIKNKCLCWFWDNNPAFVIRLGHLTKLMSGCPNNEEFNYCKDNGGAFKNCRPVRRDEVTFYEDRKDVAED